MKNSTARRRPSYARADDSNAGEDRDFLSHRTLKMPRFSPEFTGWLESIAAFVFLTKQKIHLIKKRRVKAPSRVFQCIQHVRSRNLPCPKEQLHVRPHSFGRKKGVFQRFSKILFLKKL